MRKIDTGLVGEVECNVLKSVFGQLSDGYWENSHAMQKYWNNADVSLVENQVCLFVGQDFQSPYNDMTDKEIKAWFAKRAKQVVKFLQEDSWKRNNDIPADGFLSGLTVGDVYRVYDKLLERKAR